MKPGRGGVLSYLLTKEMAAALAPGTASALGTAAVTYYAGAALSSRTLAESAFLAALITGGVVYHNRVVARDLAARNLVEGALTAASLDAEALRQKMGRLRDELTQFETASRTTGRGAVRLLESLQSISESVHQLGTRPEKCAALDVMGRSVRLASHALSEYNIGAGEMVVCLKKLVLKRGIPVAARMAIWPPHEGETECLIASSRPLERLATQRLAYYFVDDAEREVNFRLHIQFAARTILVTPIAIAPARGIGFLWVSSELPAAFDQLPVYLYTSTLGHILAPLFIGDYEGADVPNANASDVALN